MTKLAQFNGTTLHIMPDGLLPAWEKFACSERTPDQQAFREYFASKDKGVHQIIATHPAKGPSWFWTFTTIIPHSTFDVFDDHDEIFCQGIVFCLKELEPTTQASFLTEDPDHALEEVV